MNKVIVTLTGPSASGKSTLENLLCVEGEGSVFSKIVSHTTRPMRKGERDGVDYHFVTQEQFDLMDDGGQFAETVKFGTASYGAHEKEFSKVFEQGKIAVVVCEPNGQEAIAAFSEAIGALCLSVFITNPPTIRFERLLTRFIADIEHLELGGAAMRAVQSKFAERLAVVSGIEAHWQDEAWRYDYVVDSFGPGNTAAVVNHVSAEALNRLITANPELYALRNVV